MVQEGAVELRKIILRYQDGRVLRAFSPLFEDGSDPVPAVDASGMPFFVSLVDLKAAFFVRTFTGNPDYDPPKSPAELKERGTGVLVSLEFSDGETILGEIQRNTDTSKGFFLTVLDPADNNLLIYVNPASLAKPPSEA